MTFSGRQTIEIVKRSVFASDMGRKKEGLIGGSQEIFWIAKTILYVITRTEIILHIDQLYIECITQRVK
jgi:hypothetical protein